MTQDRPNTEKSPEEAPHPSGEDSAPHPPTRPQALATAISMRYRTATIPPELIALHAALEMADFLRIAGEYDFALSQAQDTEARTPSPSDSTQGAPGRSQPNEEPTND